ncbi:MAG: tRNA 2-thiouridine(34) synthase MnmA [Acidobacteriota bacterium]
MLLSGGVDSSVALHLLRRAGHRVTAFYLKIWLEDELAHLGACPWEEDLHFARAVCAATDVPLEIVSLQREYHERVVAAAIEELKRGRTPSPDVRCNRHVKLGAFLEQLDADGRTFDAIATGHYASVERRIDGVALLRGVDARKDQTYFLHSLTRPQLERCVFPLGGLHKAEVRQLAESLGLPNRHRRDSQGLCFLGKIPYDDFVRAHLGDQPGPILDLASGDRLGTHRGLWFHTIGQRKGLGLADGPWFVVAKETKSRALWVSHGARLAEHRTRHFRVPDPHWLSPLPRATAGAFDVRLRHTPALSAARWSASVSEGEPQGLLVSLHTPDSGIAAGQSAVFYRGRRCLGGGVLELLPGAHEGIQEAASRDFDR